MNELLTEKENKDFQEMVTACGRNPEDFKISILAGSEKVFVQNITSGAHQEYVHDVQADWIINFATDLKMGNI